MKIADTVKRWSEEGIRLPYAYSADSKGPSITLLFLWLSGVLTTGSLIALNFTEQTLTAAITSMCFFGLSMVFHRMRRLDKFKLDLDDRSIELDAGDEPEDK